MKKFYSFRQFFLATFIVASLILLDFTSKADTLQVTSNITPIQMVQEILIGGGVVTSNIEFTGANVSRGKFWGGPGNIGIEEGIILTSGNVTKAPGPNNAGNAGQDNNQPGDPDLTSIAGTSTFDACVLEFDFIPQSNSVSFRYVFGSEEYHEYVNSYNDAFGFFISGPGITGPYSGNSKNIALIPLTNIPVTINTVNCGNPYNCAQSCENCQFFVNNTQQFTQYDAFTKVLTAGSAVIPCETYHIKLAIGDGVDGVYDSGVFLEANSFNSIGIASEQDYDVPDFQFAIEGCNDLSILFTLSVQAEPGGFYLPIIIGGTATNGVDYEEISDSVYFQQGYSQAWLDIVTIPDQTAEFFENIRLVYNSSLCDIDYDTINISIQDYRLILQNTPDTTINCATEAVIGVRSVNGFGPFDYVWSTGDTTQYITVSPLITTTYYVTCMALCDSVTTDSITVYVNGPESNAGADQVINYGTTTTLQGSASSGSGEYTYSWEPASLLVDPTNPITATLQMQATTQFTLTVTDLAGNCQDLDRVLVEVEGGPLNVSPIAYPEAICYGTTSKIIPYAAGGNDDIPYSYLWSSDPPGFGSTLDSVVVQPEVTTTYYVQVNDGYNTITGEVTVEIIPLPVSEAGENDTIWYGTVGHLSGSAAPGSGVYTYNWQPADSLQNPNAPNPTTWNLHVSNIFRLSVTDNQTGCESTEADLVAVIVKGGPLAVVVQAADPLICGGGSTQLLALASGGDEETGYSYLWTSVPNENFDKTIPNPVVTPAANTTYFVEIFDGTNYTHGQVEVRISVPPAVNLGADVVACPMDSVHLSSGNPGLDCIWSNGSINESITIGTTGIGYTMKTIWVEVQNLEGCITRDSITVVFDFAQCFGVDENDGGTEFYLYPNPTSGIIHFEWKAIEGNVRLEVSDLHGNIILNEHILAPATGEYKGSLNLDGHPKGIYLLRVINDEKILIRKILLQ